MNYESKTVEELINIYTDAKDAYYTTGKSKLKDSEFDDLEEYLVSNDYIEKYIGTEAEITGQKIPHLSPMLSLDKVQVFTSEMDQTHIDGIIDALSRYTHQVKEIGSTMLRFTDKVDGLAANIYYYEGELKTIATRGNGSIGTDITAKCKHLVPSKVSKNFTGEVRGELYITKSDFLKLNNARLEIGEEPYMNPRNLAAGIVAVSDLQDPRIKDLKIFLFEIKGTVKTMGELPELSHLVMPSSLVSNTADEIIKEYVLMEKRRPSLDYPTDGIVIRLAAVTEHKDNGLAPLYAVAVKFPPMLAKTRIKHITWNLRKSARYIPHATLEPVELDGTIVTHAALHNYKWVESRGCYAGALVTIGKNGDIIPQIQSVDEKAEQSGLPEQFTISDNGIHMIASGDVSEIISRNKFVGGLLTLGFFGFGAANFIKLYELLSGKAENLFDNSLFTKDNLFPIFGTGKTGPEFIRQRTKILKAGISTTQLLLMMQFDSCGNRHSKAIGKVILQGYLGESFEFDESGLNRSVIENVLRNETNFQRIRQAIGLYIANDYLFLKPVEKIIQEGDVTFEMTGSPKLAGFKSKEDFVAYVSTWNHTKLKKNTTYLVTDDKISKTSKMKFADTNGITVLTYEEAVELFKKSL